MLIEVDGDLITFVDAQYIAHQCNCVSTNSAGIAHSIFSNFPHADTYKKRTNKEKSVPGTIEIFGGDGKERGVINLFAQYYPGSSKYDNDTVEKRIEWMKICLAKIYNMRENIDSIAFPHGMGCNLAGGDWNVYKSLIQKLADNMPNTKVYIVKKEIINKPIKNIEIGNIEIRTIEDVRVVENAFIDFIGGRI